MNAPCLPWSGRQLQIFCHIVALYPSISIRFTMKPVRLLVAFDAGFETGEVIISDLKVHIRKPPVVSSQFQIIGVVVKDR